MQIKSEEAFNTFKMLTSEGVNRDKKNLLAALLQTGIGTTGIQREIDSAKRFKRAFASIFIHAFSGAHVIKIYKYIVIYSFINIYL